MNTTQVQRNDDMHPKGEAALMLILQSDGDVVVCVRSLDQITQRSVTASVEFCQPGSGGGKSPHTLSALKALAIAIKKDNATYGDGLAGGSKP